MMKIIIIVILAAAQFLTPSDAQVYPEFYNILSNEVVAVNGSLPSGNCTPISLQNATRYTCDNPRSSVLFDSKIPTLTCLNNSEWASHLLILNTSVSSNISFGFTATGYAGVQRIEVVMFNCPQWGIGTSSIAILGPETLTGTIGTINSADTTSCDSLVRVCTSKFSTTQSVITLQFHPSQVFEWVELAEVTFYTMSSNCPTQCKSTTSESGDTTSSFTTQDVVSTPSSASVPTSGMPSNPIIVQFTTSSLITTENTSEKSFSYIVPMVSVSTVTIIFAIIVVTTLLIFRSKFTKNKSPAQHITNEIVQVQEVEYLASKDNASIVQSSNLKRQFIPCNATGEVCHSSTDLPGEIPHKKRDTTQEMEELGHNKLPQGQLHDIPKDLYAQVNKPKKNILKVSSISSPEPVHQLYAQVDKKKKTIALASTKVSELPDAQVDKKKETLVLASIKVSELSTLPDGLNAKVEMKKTTALVSPKNSEPSIVPDGLYAQVEKKKKTIVLASSKESELNLLSDGLYAQVDKTQKKMKKKKDEHNKETPEESVCEAMYSVVNKQKAPEITSKTEDWQDCC